MRTKKVIRLGDGTLDEEQVDCEKGLISIHAGSPRTKNPTTRTFQLSNGAKVGETKGHLRRIGRLIKTDKAIIDLNGSLVHALPPRSRQAHADYITDLIWDGNRRLAIVGQGDRVNDSKDVVELDKDWKKGKRVKLSDYAMSFTKIVGNPDKGTFAVFESSNRTMQTTGLFTRRLTSIRPAGRFQVTDIGPHGILALRLKVIEGYNGDAIDGSVCLDPTTAKTIWTAKASGKWMGINVFSGTQILDGRTGKVPHTIKFPKTTNHVLGSSGDLIITIEQYPVEKIVAYRLR